jgi:hypothetical protein
MTPAFGAMRDSDETLDPLKKVHLVVDELVLTKRGF